MMTTASNRRLQRDSSFDRVVVEASRATGAPVALLGFLSSSAESIIAATGWDVRDFPLQASFAARITDARDVVVAPDASLDPRFASHPLVAHAPHVRFVAAVPLILPDGTFAGPLSVIDRAPRMLTAHQVEILRLLGRDVVHELTIERERETQKEMLEESEARFREFFEQTDDLVMSIAPDGRLLHANASTINALGLDRDAALIRMIDPESRDGFRAAFAKAFESGEPQRVETTFITADGRSMIVDGSLRPRIIDGKPLPTRVIFRDIRAPKQYATELGRPRDAALQA